MHGSDETITSKFNNNPSFTGEHRSMGLVCRRPRKAVSVSRAPPSRNSDIPNGVGRLSSLVKNEEKNDFVYRTPSVPCNYMIQDRRDRTRYNTLMKMKLKSS